MEAYRDQYATLFNNGRNIVVIGVSADADTTLASWAREQDFPMLFASDSKGVAGRLYDAFLPDRNQDNRSLYVIDPEGRIVWSARPFRPLVAAAYTELGEVIDRVSPPVEEAGG